MGESRSQEFHRDSLFQYRADSCNKGTHTLDVLQSSGTCAFLQLWYFAFRNDIDSCLSKFTTGLAKGLDFSFHSTVSYCMLLVIHPSLTAAYRHSSKVLCLEESMQV